MFLSLGNFITKLEVFKLGTFSETYLTMLLLNITENLFISLHLTVRENVFGYLFRNHSVP